MKTSTTIILILLSVFCYSSFSSQCLDEENVYSFVYNGHTYEVVKEIKQWTEASACAVSRNGYLAEINTEEEQNVIFEELTENADIDITNTENEFGTASVWLGGSDSGTEGNWIWDGNNDAIGQPFWTGGPSGTPIGSLYTNWGISPAEPDNSGNQDHLTIIIKPTATNFGLWNDLSTNTSIYYLIEYDDILSVNESEWQKKVNLYPNPVSDFVTIDNDNVDAIDRIDIFNLAGQNIRTYVKSDFIEQSIDVSNLENGVYIFAIHFESGGITNRRLIK